MEENSNHNYFWRLLNFFPRPWLTVWLWIMLANIVLGIATPESPTLMLIRLGGVILCLVYAVRYFPTDRLLQLAMLVTVVADLILANNHIAEIGVLCFLIAQVVHLLRLSPASTKTPILIGIIVTSILIIADLLLEVIPPIILLGGLYFLCLLTNTGVSWRWWRQNRKNLQAFCALLGFTLFIACDLCVAVSYLSFVHFFPSLLYAPANFFTWFFYYPSQILVSNGSKYDKMYLKGR